jgi:flagellar hook-associated protein 2
MTTGLIGLGSETASGANKGLSQDTLDKLREVDNNAIVTPIESNIETNSEKQTALATIIEAVKGVDTLVEGLNDEMLYLERSATISNTGINLSIDKGVSPQNISVEVTQLAKQDVIQTKPFFSLDEVISSDGGTFDLKVDGIDYSFDISPTTSFSDLKDAINDHSTIPVTAKIIKTGEDEYRLTLTSDKTGSDYKIEVSEGELGTGLGDEENNVQKAQNAEFLFNGTPISRNENVVTDLVIGVELELTEVTENPINISIDVDKQGILAEVQSFVDAYNELTVLLAEMTKFDEETNETGVFQGNSNITSINQAIKRKLLSMDSENRSPIEFGIVLNSTGQLELNVEEFSAKLEEDPSLVENFFRGEDVEDRGVTTHVDGLFHDLENIVGDYVDDMGVLNLYSQNLDVEEERLNEEKEKAIALLDGKYDRMAEQFIQADALIAEWTQKFNSVQMLIDFQTADN